MYANGGIPGASFADKSFATGRLGTWQMDFAGNGLNSMSIFYYETEPDTFTFTVYGLDMTTVLQGGTAIALGTPNSLTFQGYGQPIGRVVFTDLGASGGPGDNVQFDNLSVDTSAIVGDEVPEPSTIALLGTALAGLGFLSRRKK